METEGIAHAAGRGRPPGAVPPRGARAPAGGARRRASPARSSCTSPSGRKRDGSSRACASAASRSMYIISGDHETPTRRLAETLGIERYFAETLPEDKASLIERTAAVGQGRVLRGGRHQRFDRDEEIARLGLAARRLDAGRRHGRGRPARREPERAVPPLRHRTRVRREHDRRPWPPSSFPAWSASPVSCSGYVGFAEARLFNIAGLVGRGGRRDAAAGDDPPARRPRPREGSAPTGRPDAATIEEHVFA